MPEPSETATPRTTWASTAARSRPARLAGGAARALAARPGMLLGPFEAHRAAMEAAGLFALLPPLLLKRPVDPHPVLVVPGLSGGTQWCAVLRGYLTALGHQVHQPTAGATKGRLGTVTTRLGRQVRQLSESAGTEVSLIGWSIGGCMVRQVALADPTRVRQVVTLGAPSGGFWYAEVPGTADQPMPVPTCSIYSRTDPWFDPRACIQPPSPRCEDVPVPSSHLGMATNAFAYHVIADRLALPRGEWSPYQPPRLPFPEAARPAGGTP